MTKYEITPLLLIATVFLFAGQRSIPGRYPYRMAVDTMPDICSVLPPHEIDALHIFSNPLTKAYTEPDPLDNFRACYYEFYKPNDYPSLTVQMTRFESKEEAREEFHLRVVGHYDLWGMYPERISDLADSAFFGYNQMDATKCDECSLIAAQGAYVIYITYKGQAETAGREWKKLNAIKIIYLMYARIPGLAQSLKRN